MCPPRIWWLRAFQRRRGATVDARQWMAFQPECASRRCRIDVLTLPPCLLIAGTMQLAMMPPTHRYGELVADLLPHGATLRKAKMVRIRRPPPANETSLLSNRPEVLAVANPSWLRQCQGELIDSLVRRDRAALRSGTASLVLNESLSSLAWKASSTLRASAGNNSVLFGHAALGPFGGPLEAIECINLGNEPVTQRHRCRAVEHTRRWVSHRRASALR